MRWAGHQMHPCVTSVHVLYIYGKESRVQTVPANKMFGCYSVITIFLKGEIKPRAIYHYLEVVGIYKEICILVC